MNIVLMESLGVDDSILSDYILKLKDKGHDFKVYNRSDDIKVQKEQIKDADIVIIANMPLSGEVISSAKRLKAKANRVSSMPLKSLKHRNILTINECLCMH